MQVRHSERHLYFSEQEYTTRKHVIPCIKEHLSLVAGMRVLEIGCGEGGNLKPFLDMGCLVTGVDLSAHKISLAGKFLSLHPENKNLRLICDDIYHLDPPVEKFDLIIMRDVIEHIHNQPGFMVFVRQFMHPGTLFFLAFPPWCNPFGGHQQICSCRILGMTPYLHLLPGPLYPFILKIAGEKKGTIDSLLEIKDTRLSIERFEKIASTAGFIQKKRKFYLINPNYEIKYRLKPVKQNRWIAGIPYIRNFMTTAAYYLLVMK